MAEKPKIRIDREARGEEPTYYAQEDLPEKYQDLSWRLWFTRVYARTFFVIICLWTDSMIWLNIRFDLHQPWELATLIAIAAVIPEYYLFRRLWGRRKLRASNGADLPNCGKGQPQ